MVRRAPGVADVDGGTQSAVYGNGVQLLPETADTAPARGTWRGGGGRWLLWPMRVILWAAVIIIGYRGIAAIVLNEGTDSGTGAGAAASDTSGQFPATLAEAYAMQFGQVYLNFSPGTATLRAQQLAQFIPSSVSGSNSEFGWNGSGSMKMQSEQVAGIDVRNAQTAVVTLLASVNGQLMELGVPIYSSGGGLTVSGEPAWLPAPSAAQAPVSQESNSDPVAQSALMNQLPAFFQAYASGDSVTMNRFLVQGVSLSGLNGAVSFNSIASLTVPPGGATRDITVTVNWQLAGQAGSNGAQLTATYDMTVIDQQSGKWYVKDIRASTEPMGSQ